tara:strand:+ start:4459 stop:4689 length:231 start_codon:yes stop_codon:yes gene_type:complete
MDKDDKKRSVRDEYLWELLEPHQHHWQTTDSGVPVCIRCKLNPDDPFVTIAGGWKTGQCWGENGLDFIMRLITEGV